MDEEYIKIINKLKSLRVSQQRSLNDCAKVLGVTPEIYHQVEQGQTPLTLPELELLSFFLNVSPTVFFEDNWHPQPKEFLNLEDFRTQYKILRNKMINAKLVAAQNQSGASPGEAKPEADNISNINRPQNIDGLSIPLEALLKISKSLEVPQETFIEPIDDCPQNTIKQPSDRSESSQLLEESEHVFNEDIISGFRTLSIEDQAAFAKSIVEKLKSTLQDKA